MFFEFAKKLKKNAVETHVSCRPRGKFLAIWGDILSVSKRTAGPLCVWLRG